MTRGRLALLPLLLAAITLAVFWRVSSFDFINFDDIGYVSENPRVQRGLTFQNIVWAFTTLELANWHPLTWLSHMFDCTLFRQADGTQAAGMHHLVNLLWHTANTVILFLVLSAMTGARWRSLLVAALFALHPLHVQSVAWVAERKDVLCTFFGLLAIAAYLGWVRRRQRTWLAASLALYALSLMAKPMLVTLPFALLLLDYWPLRRMSRVDAAAPQVRMTRNRTASPVRTAKPKPRGPWTMLIVEKWPYLALATASSIITVIAQSRGGAMENMEQVGLDVRLGNAIIAYGQYINQTIWPTRLGVLYPYPQAIDPVVLFSTVALLLVVSFAAIATARRWPHVIVGWLWFLGTLVPVIGLVQVGEQARADRYTYVPLIGLFIIITWMIPAPRAERPSRSLLWLRVVPVGLVLAVLAALTYRQVGHWRDSKSLYEHTLAVTGDNPVVHHNLGVALMQRGDPEGAVAHLRKAVQLRKNYLAASRNLGRVLLDMGRVDEGVAQLETAVTAAPDFAQTISDLGVGYKQQGKIDQAVRQFEQAIRLDPDLLQPRLNLGAVFFDQQQFEKALPPLEHALKLEPRDGRAQYYLGASLAGLGRLDQALRHLEQATKALPNWIDPRISLGSVLLDLNRFDQAIAQSQQALKLSGEPRAKLIARNNLARALALSGRFEQALAECQTLIDAAPDNPAYCMNLAVLLITASDENYRDPIRAVQLADKACQLTNRTDPTLMGVLAQTQAAAKMFEQAVQTAQQALDLAKAQGNIKMADDIQHQITLYRSGRSQ